MNIDLAISVAIFVVSLFMVIKKPFRIDIGYSALIGALVTAVLGLITLDQVITVLSIVWNATLTFVSVVIISLIFDESGVFHHLALKLMKLSHGSGVRLFTYVIVGGAFISAIFANDGTALVLTPIIISLLSRAGFREKSIIAYVMAVGFIADSASIPLLVSNLVNIIAATYFGIAFFPYMEAMIFPDLVSIAASLTFLYIIYRKDIPKKFNSEYNVEEDYIKDRTVFRLFYPVITALIILYSIGGFFSIPIAFVAMPMALFMVLLSRRGKAIDYVKVVKEAPWQIIIFSLGMYIVVFAMAEHGLASMLSSVLLYFSSYPYGLNFVISGFIFAFTASIMNNLPSVLLGDIALKTGGFSGYIVLTNAIGNDIGPKFTPIGSLATLVWLYMIKRKSGIKIKTVDYMKTGLFVGIPVLTLTLLSLWVETIL